MLILKAFSALFTAIITKVLFFPLRPFHRFNWYHHNFITALLTNIGFATGTGETVAARFREHISVPGFSTVRAGKQSCIFRHNLWLLIIYEPIPSWNISLYRLRFSQCNSHFAGNLGLSFSDMTGLYLTILPFLKRCKF